MPIQLEIILLIAIDTANIIYRLECYVATIVIGRMRIRRGRRLLKMNEVSVDKEEEQKKGKTKV